MILHNILDIPKFRISNQELTDGKFHHRIVPFLKMLVGFLEQDLD